MNLTFSEWLPAMTQGFSQNGDSINSGYDTFYHGRCQIKEMDGIGSEPWQYVSVCTVRLRLHKGLAVTMTP